MSDLSDPKNFEKWLENQSPENCLIIGARSALRAIPVMGVMSHKISSHTSDIVLPIFRCMAASWFSAQYPKHNNKILTYAGEIIGPTSEASAIARDLLYAVDASADASIEALRCLIFAESSYYSKNSIARATAACAAAAGNTASAKTDIFNSLRAAAAADATFVDSPDSTDTLIHQPLWLIDCPRKLTDKWRLLRSALQAEGADWDVWTNWYVSRLRGKKSVEGAELFRVIGAVSKSDMNFWKQKPSEINKAIKDVESNPANFISEMKYFSENISEKLIDINIQNKKQKENSSDNHISIQEIYRMLSNSTPILSDFVVSEINRLKSKCPNDTPKYNEYQELIEMLSTMNVAITHLRDAVDVLPEGPARRNSIQENLSKILDILNVYILRPDPNLLVCGAMFSILTGIQHYFGASADLSLSVIATVVFGPGAVKISADKIKKVPDKLKSIINLIRD